MRNISILALVCLLTGSASGQGEVPLEDVDLIPERAAWGLRNVGVGFASFLGGWRYWYGERATVIRTVPAETQLGLYYIRSNFQKRYERVPAPARVSLPARVHTTEKDAVRIRVFADGYLVKELSYTSRALPDELLVELDPLPNNLVFFGHTHLANRTTLTLRTSEEPDLRINKRRGAPGFNLALAKTANKLDADFALRGGHVERLAVAQVGEDLVAGVALTDPDLEVRSKSRHDRVRNEFVYILDIVKKGQRAPSHAQIAERLATLPHDYERACNDRFEAALRDGLDPEDVARAFRANGGIGDLLRRQAMIQLGRRAQGRVRTRGGDQFRTGSPIELELALQAAAEVRGYFALLDSLARDEGDAPIALRSLIAPELSPDEFEPIYAAARRACPD